MKKLCADLPRLLVHLLLLPFVLLWVPLMFAMAWVHEVFEDLRPPRLRPAPVLLPAHSALPPFARSPLRR
ncbi:MAG TPA: hypothetical protein VMF64_00695 [Steroidobacteraceae bacterium]|nr:hypothetical protein [Steroidobacteraceae bacterium]